MITMVKKPVKIPTEPCEACMKTHAHSELTSTYGDEKTYKLCANCLFQLVAYSLSPEQYRNLLLNGHSPHEFYIHEDFYDDDGNAMQPMFRPR